MDIGKARRYLSKDLTLLGVPGDEFWWAHWNYELCYGKEDYEKWKAWAQARHQKWVDDGYTFSFHRNWQGKHYMHATPPPK